MANVNDTVVDIMQRVITEKLKEDFKNGYQNKIVINPSRDVAMPVPINSPSQLTPTLLQFMLQPALNVFPPVFPTLYMQNLGINVHNQVMQAQPGERTINYGRYSRASISASNRKCPKCRNHNINADYSLNHKKTCLVSNCSCKDCEKVNLSRRRSSEYNHKRAFDYRNLRANQQQETQI